MKLDHLRDIDQLESFVQGSQAVAFVVASNKRERYRFIEHVLKRFDYARLKRREKGIVIQFLMKVSNYSRQQLTRLIWRYHQQGKLVPQQKTANGFEQIYSAEDIRLLAQLDQRHDTPNGLRVKKLCERAYYEFNESAYQRLAHISVVCIPVKIERQFQFNRTPIPVLPEH